MPGKQWVPKFIKDLLDGSKFAGGTSGQVLTKNSGTDYDFGWATPSGGSGGGITITDLTGASSDYNLTVGNIAKITYTSATSVPLHVLTNGGLFAVEIMGDASVTPSNSSAVTLAPNNTSYTNAFTFIQHNDDSTSGNSTSTATMSTPQMGQGNIIGARWLLRTTTKAKTFNGDTVVKDTGATRNLRCTLLWNDTTTAWTSLGTISFPFAQSGTVIVRRLF